MSKLAMHRTGSHWSPVRTLPVVPLWCDLEFVPTSRGNKAAANLRPIQETHTLQLSRPIEIIHCKVHVQKFGRLESIHVSEAAWHITHIRFFSHMEKISYSGSIVCFQASTSRSVTKENKIDFANAFMVFVQILEP